MKFDKYMIVYEKSQVRCDNYEEAKSHIEGLKKFPAADTINQFDKFEKLALEKNYSSVDYTKGEICRQWNGKLGCNVSHQMLWDHFLKNSTNEWLVVFEDDLIIKNYKSDKKLTEILKTSYKNNSNFVQMYTNPEFISKQTNKQKIKKDLYKMIPQWHTIAYAITRNGIITLKNNYPVNVNIDLFLSESIQKLNSFCWLNNVFLNAGDQPKTKPTYDEDGNEVWGRRDLNNNQLGSLIWDNWNEQQ